MRAWTKNGIGMLVISMALSFVSPAQSTGDEPQAQKQLAMPTFAAFTGANTLAFGTGDKGQRGKSGATKDKSKKKTRAAGQRAHREAGDKHRA
jgi:hypothetical protein